MVNISIAPEISTLCPNLQLGCLSFNIKGHQSAPDLQAHIQTVCTQLQQQYTTPDIAKIPNIQAARAAYKALGKDPSRYRLSAEALLRRIVKQKGLYQISPTVDLLNLLSIQTGYSIGGYDYQKIQGAITLRKGTTTDEYQAIGKGAYNIANLPTLADDQGPFGTPTSDSTRTMFTTATSSFLMVFFDFAGKDDLSTTLAETVDLYQQFTQIEQPQVDIIT